VPICVKTVHTNLATNEQTDRWTDKQVGNIMPPTASLA